MSDKAELKKQAQAILKEAGELLDKAAELAEQGKFQLSFMGGRYVPKSGVTGDVDVEDDLSEEQREELDRNGLWIDEYQPLGDWWVPSNC